MAKAHSTTQAIGEQLFDVSPDDALDKMADRVEAQRARIFQTMGIISCVAAVVPDGVPDGEPDIRYALEAVHGLLDDICAELDPTHFMTEAPNA